MRKELLFLPLLLAAAASVTAAGCSGATTSSALGPKPGLFLLLLAASRHVRRALTEREPPVGLIVSFRTNKQAYILSGRFALYGALGKAMAGFGAFRFLDL